MIDVGAIYFDLDDTLCGYWDACKHGLRETFTQHGPDGHDVDDLIRHWAAAFREFLPTVKQEGWYSLYCKKGEPTRTEQMRLTLLRLGIEDSALASRLSQAYLDARHDHLELFDGALEVLNALKPRYPLGLITNGPADIQRMEIAILGIDSYFQHFFIEGELGFGKPDEEVFHLAEAAVGLPPEKLLFVGNSYAHDIRPAIEAGWKTAWIRRPSDVSPSAGPGPSKPEEMPDGAPKPDAEITELKQLLALLP